MQFDQCRKFNQFNLRFAQQDSFQFFITIDHILVVWILNSKKNTPHNFFQGLRKHNNIKELALSIILAQSESVEEYEAEWMLFYGFTFASENTTSNLHSLNLANQDDLTLKQTTPYNQVMLPSSILTDTVANDKF